MKEISEYVSITNDTKKELKNVTIGEFVNNIEKFLPGFVAELKNSSIIIHTIKKAKYYGKEKQLLGRAIVLKKPYNEKDKLEENFKTIINLVGITRFQIKMKQIILEE